MAGRATEDPGRQGPGGLSQQLPACSTVGGVAGQLTLGTKRALGTPHSNLPGAASNFPDPGGLHGLHGLHLIPESTLPACPRCGFGNSHKSRSHCRAAPPLAVPYPGPSPAARKGRSTGHGSRLAGSLSALARGLHHGARAQGDGSRPETWRGATVEGRCGLWAKATQAPRHPATRHPQCCAGTRPNGCLCDSTPLLHPEHLTSW